MSDSRPEEGADASAAATETHTPAGTADMSVGPYRVLQRLGEGGMGEVWLAEQSRPLRRQVAVKVIKPGLDTAQVVARFEAERQALALMDHPAIAKVFDAGSTGQGRLYFAMEYVRGESLILYCDRHQLTIADRLDLFLQLCEGVQHAHQKGIIHRDLKPSNILVTMQDDRPVPKIIDFGIAKATSQPLTERTIYTSLGGFIGTLEYMSPEQAEMGGVDIDTRTDVYALGVILYELLTGVLPVDRQRLVSSGLEEARHTIREVDPPRPSFRVTERRDTTQTAAKSRGTDSGRLASLLRGDLDWITLKALEKDRRRRYATASELAADIRRHVAHEPVLASPPSARYRLTKFVRRNRLAVGAAGGLMLLLAVFATTMALQARRVALERDRANREAATAKQVSDFLIGLFKVSDPSEARGNTLTAREILESGVANIETGLAGQPEVQARMMGTMGSIYTNLGLYEPAERLLTQAVATNRRIFGDESATTLAAVNDLANVYWFQEQYARAEPLYLEVIERRRRLLGDQHPDTLRASNDLASLYVLQKRFNEAERLARATLETHQRALGPEHPDTRFSLNILQNIYFSQERYTDAEPISTRALAMSRKALGEEHPDTLVDKHNMATLYDKLGRYAEAERLYLSTIESMRRVLGPRHRTTVNSIMRLAAMYQTQQRFIEAESQLTTTLGGLGTGAGNSSTTRALVTQLAKLYDAWGRPAQSAEIRAKLPK
jgi:serine/threonine protein kinase/tetratricopeptide (TPR) repeat protein